MLWFIISIILPLVGVGLIAVADIINSARFAAEMHNAKAVA